MRKKRKKKAYYIDEEVGKTKQREMELNMDKKKSECISR